MTYKAAIISGDFQTAGVIQAAHGFNCPLLLSSCATSSSYPADLNSLFSSDQPAIIIDTVKVGWAFYSRK